MDKNIRAYGKGFRIEYLKEIVQLNVTNYTGYNLNSVQSYVECFTDNMEYLFFDYAYQVMPFFWLDNQVITT